MKILFYLPLLTNSGGVERALSSLVNSMSLNKDVEVLLLTNFGNRGSSFFEISSNVRIIDLGISQYRKNYLKILIDIFCVIKREKPNYFVNVEVLSMLFSFPYMFVFWNKTTKYLVWEHFNFLNSNGRKLRSFLRRIAARFCDGIITLTNRDVDTWNSNLKINGEITAIPNISSFSGVRNDYNLSSTNIIAVGRLTHVKGFARLLDCWKSFTVSNPDTIFKLQIIGSGDLLSQLSLQIKELKIDTSVEIIPQTKDIIEYYSSASFICLTSYHEGLPMVLIEGQSFGLPIIAFDCYTGPSEIISEQSGILVPLNSNEAFSEAIGKLTKNSTLRKSMSIQARKESLRYTGTEVVKNWLDFLEKLG